jgi:hypothetical protein
VGLVGYWSDNSKPYYNFFFAPKNLKHNTKIPKKGDIGYFHVKPQSAQTALHAEHWRILPRATYFVILAL